ncbi:MAG: bifunctional oligoribonuclease/PAP phosphatase NrnA [Clostridia bacterium]|nr:bifunctional oligoribonuclease/PAP phosphatase NrnA [Clostridia bacterium]
MNKLNFTEAIKAIKTGKNFSIFIHISPDGDCVGSAKSVEYLLKSLGKETHIICEDEPSFDSKFLCEQFEDSLEVVENSDTLICVDVSGLSRVGKYGEYLKNTQKPLIVFDHHIPQDDFGTIVCRDSNKSSATEIIYDLLQEMKFDITPELANYLYAGISSDTGCFVQANTTESTLKAAAHLMELGADTQKINYELFIKRPENYIDISMLAYKNLKIYGDKLSLVTIKYNTYKKFIDLNTFYLIDALKFYPTDALVIVTQKDKNTVKLSTRSRNYNVQELCAHFGGGGHKHASGATFEGNFKKTIKEIKKIVLGSK